jgi:uncharacterized protein (TIGR00266 family)
MQIDIEYSPAYAMATTTLDAGESVKSEAGAMVAMSGGVRLETSTGGIVKGLKRMALGGESFFLTTYTAEQAGAQVAFAPSLPGDVVHQSLAGETMFVQSGSYLASGPGVDVETRWGGAKTFFSREGLFVLKASGTGDLLLSSYGAIHERTLAAGETFTVDTGHMVAWSERVQYSVRKIAGWKATLTSGEGLVVDLTGPGTVYLQTRSPESFIDWLAPKLPTQRS